MQKTVNSHKEEKKKARKKTSLAIDPEIWSQLKMYSAITGKKVYDLVEEAIIAYLGNIDAHTQIEAYTEQMNKSRSMKKVKEILEEIQKGGFQKEISLNAVISVITSIAGSDNRTIKKYLQLLVGAGYLSPRTHKIFRINYQGSERMEIKKGKAYVKLVSNLI